MVANICTVVTFVRQSMKNYSDNTMIWNELQAYLPKNSPLQSRFARCLGLAGFYAFLTSTHGFCVVGRAIFFSNLILRQENAIIAKAHGSAEASIGMFGEFLDYALRIRNCDDDQVYIYYIYMSIFSLVSF
jgi:hypothetical protein